jgi:hypothetical protein
MYLFPERNYRAPPAYHYYTFELNEQQSLLFVLPTICLFDEERSLGRFAVVAYSYKLVSSVIAGRRMYSSGQMDCLAALSC